MDKILTFDCYGTLIDTSPLYMYISSVAETNGIAADKAKGIFVNYEDRLMYGEDYVPYIDLLRYVLEYCDMELNTNIFESEWQNVLNIHKKFMPYSDVSNSLKKLKDSGYHLYLMSNSMHSIMSWHLEVLDPIFDDVILAEDTHCYKPSLNFFNYAQTKLCLGNTNHCHIAAGYWWDIVPCSKLGWNKIWVNRRNYRGNDRHQPYKEIHSLAELSDII
jgi:2-haloacid dehalogenase